MKAYLSLVLACLVTASISSVAVDAAEIINPSFELPAIPDDQNFAFVDPGGTIGSGWVVDATSGSSILVLKSGLAGSQTTHDGGQYAIISDGASFGTIHQDLRLDAADYRLTFQMASEQGTPNASTTINILRGGTSVIGGASAFNALTGEGFGTEEVLFKATGSDDFRIVVAATSGWVAIDAFALQEVTAIPEPSSVALLAMIAAPLISSRRRKVTLRR